MPAALKAGRESTAAYVDDLRLSAKVQAIPYHMIAWGWRENGIFYGHSLVKRFLKKKFLRRCKIKYAVCHRHVGTASPASHADIPDICKNAVDYAGILFATE